MTGVKGRHRHPDAQAPAAPRDTRRLPEEDAQALLLRFPPRPSLPLWPATGQTREQVLARLFAPPFTPGNSIGQAKRRGGLRRMLDWLAGQPGGTWQERWIASGADRLGNTAWRGLAVSWVRNQGIGFADESYLHLGGALRVLICGDVIRPSLSWLTTPGSVRFLAAEMTRVRDPAAFAALATLVESGDGQATAKANPMTRAEILCRIATIMAAKGGSVRDITVGDCMELLSVISEEATGNRLRRNSLNFYQALHALGVFPADAPATVRVFRTHGRLPAEQLIDRYDIACRPIRDLLVDYLRERQTGLDYSTLQHLSYELGRLFWKDLELHHPGISSLRLTPAAAAGWKQRVQVITTRHGSRPRAGALNCMTIVRAFYLDIAHWATEDPARWGPWVVPCPIRLEEASHIKERQHRKSRMDQRTRERLP